MNTNLDILKYFFSNNCEYEYSIKVKDNIIHKNRFLVTFRNPSKELCIDICNSLGLQNFEEFIDKYLYNDFYVALEGDKIKIYCDNNDNSLTIFSKEGDKIYTYKIDSSYIIDGDHFYRYGLVRNDGQIYFKLKTTNVPKNSFYQFIKNYNQSIIREFSQFYDYMIKNDCYPIWIQLSDGSFTIYFRTYTFFQSISLS